MNTACSMFSLLLLRYGTPSRSQMKFCSRLVHRFGCSLLIAVSGGIIFGTDHQTPPLLRALIYRLNDVYQFLLIFQNPVELIIIASSKIAHLEEPR